MPKLPFGSLPTGWQIVTVQGVTFKSSRVDNPMLQVEVSIDSTGQLTDIYLVLTTDGGQVREFLLACGFHKEAHELRQHRVPLFELDDLIGKQLKVYIPPYGGFIKSFIGMEQRGPAMTEILNFFEPDGLHPNDLDF